MPRSTAGVLAAVLLWMAGCGGAAGTSGTAAPAASAPSGTASASFKGHTLRVAVWGGVFGDAIKAAVGDPVAAQTGATIQYTFANPRDHIAKLVASQGGAPPFDVVFLDDAVQALAVQRGLLAKVPDDAVPNIKQLYPIAVTAPGYGAGFYLALIGIVYNTQKYQQLGLPAPESAADLWNPKLKGHVAVPNIDVAMNPFLLEAAGAWAGSGPDDVQAALARIKELNPSVYTSSSVLEQQLASGDVWAAWSIDGRTYTLAAKGVPLAFVNPKIGSKVGMTNFGTVNVANGTKEEALAEIFVNRVYSAEAQEKIAQMSNYGPTNSQAAEAVAKDPKFAHFIHDPNQMANLYRLDNDYVNQHFQEWTDAWNKAMVK